MGHVVGLNLYKIVLHVGNGDMLSIEENDNIDEVFRSLDLKPGRAFLLVHKDQVKLSKLTKKKKRLRGELFDVWIIW